MQRLRAAAGRLPQVSGLGLEVHLGPKSPRTDLCLRLQRADLCAARPAPDEDGGCGVAALAGTAFTQPGWRPLHDFLSAWAAGTPAADDFSSVENVWVELDLDSAYTPQSPPSLFFDIDRAGRLAVGAQLAAVDRVLRALQQTVVPAARQWLAQCVERALPALRLYYLGLMLSRNSQGFRVCLRGSRAEAIAPYLDSIGWGGEHAQLAALLGRYVTAGDQFVLDIDVADSTQAPIGVELFAGSSQRWQEVFSHLQADGLCSAEQAQATLGWPGRAPRTGSRGQLQLRRLNHIKLSYSPAQPLRAKGYLYLCTAG